MAIVVLPRPGAGLRGVSADSRLSSDRGDGKFSMIKINLQQLEVWFVTGSQHLYGPETLKANAPLQSVGLIGPVTVPAIETGK